MSANFTTGRIADRVDARAPTDDPKPVDSQSALRLVMDSTALADGINRHHPRTHRRPGMVLRRGERCP